MTAGKNVFITGPSGTGKSSVIKLFKQLYGRQKTIAITSTTGISALLIGGTTLHSYLGIGLGTGSVGALTTKIMKKPYLRERWKKLDVLIIDEVSMLSPELFDKLEAIARGVDLHHDVGSVGRRGDEPALTGVEPLGGQLLADRHREAHRLARRVGQRASERVEVQRPRERQRDDRLG